MSPHSSWISGGAAVTTQGLEVAASPSVPVTSIRSTPSSSTVPCISITPPIWIEMSMAWGSSDIARSGWVTKLPAKPSRELPYWSSRATRTGIDSPTWANDGTITRVSARSVADRTCNHGTPSSSIAQVLAASKRLAVGQWRRSKDR